MSSSPGYPYTSQAPTNGEWLKWNGVEADPFQLDVLWHDTQVVLSGQWDTVLKCFIKREPHKLSKVEEGRYRLIMASPLCVQMAWHMLFDFMNDLEIKEAYNIPCQQGIAMVGGGWKAYKKQWESIGTTHALDKKAWDWTAPYWTILMDLELRYRLGRGDHMNRWYVIAKILYDQMFEHPKILTSGGIMLRQVVPGIMKSGIVNTISTNGHCQCFIHAAVCLMLGLPFKPWPRCCGDDTLSHLLHCCDLGAYNRLGVKIKSVSDTMEFCGHEFRDSGPVPLYWLKHLKKLQFVSDDVLPQYLDSMARMYVHTIHYDFWERIARLLGCPLQLSKAAYLYWYDFEQ
uniref:Putative RdRp n=1 Tax=Leveillula taurica associated sobemo-like virus 1 TaxID=2754863 RepID=A0A7D6J2L9_9VIRU|nr:putative RdRp [Leveillula taurica associated sobemo-like virus 1]